jgi:hypothetical protein
MDTYVFDVWHPVVLPVLTNNTYTASDTTFIAQEIFFTLKIQ